MKIQFVFNAAGERTAALVPIKEWERLQQKQPKPAPPRRAADTPAKEQFKEDFRAAVREMKQMQEGKIPKYSLRKFLAELDQENGLL